jgi:hypothetical protein
MKTTTQLVALALLVLASIAGAQVMDYGIQIPKLKESAEVAGIESYRMTRESGLVEVEVFGPVSQLLADCEMEITEARVVIECTLADDGKRYRSTYHKQNESAQFEDLNTGDYIIVRYSHPAKNREIIHLEPGKPLPRPQGRWLVKGTKTKEEAEQEWGHAMSLLRLTAAEVEATLSFTKGNARQSTLLLVAIRSCFARTHSATA